MIYQQFSFRMLTHVGRFRLGMCVLAMGAFVLAPFAAETSAAQSDSERLERLEKAVELLQQRNAELEREVSSLKKQKSSTTALSPEKRSNFVPDSKSYVEKSETTEEKKPVYVVPGTSEIKLTLGGLLQTQYEAGDVSAFEGRFPGGPSELHDRFRIRRARINITGDFAEQPGPGRE